MGAAGQLGLAARFTAANPALVVATAGLISMSTVAVLAVAPQLARMSPLLQPAVSLLLALLYPLPASALVLAAAGRCAADVPSAFRAASARFWPVLRATLASYLLFVLLVGPPAAASLLLWSTGGGLLRSLALLLSLLLTLVATLAAVVVSFVVPLDAALGAPATPGLRAMWRRATGSGMFAAALPWAVLERGAGRVAVLLTVVLAGQSALPAGVMFAVLLASPPLLAVALAAGAQLLTGMVIFPPAAGGSAARCSPVGTG